MLWRIFSPHWTGRSSVKGRRKIIITKMQRAADNNSTDDLGIESRVVAGPREGVKDSNIVGEDDNDKKSNWKDKNTEKLHEEDNDPRGNNQARRRREKEASGEIEAREE